MTASAWLDVDGAALAANHARLKAEAAGAEVAPVVKADAYGLGLAPVARLLASNGAATFFVAQLGEAQALRRIAPQARIFVLNGVAPGTAAALADAAVVPVLNAPEEIAEWTAQAKARNTRLPAAVQIDTGLNRSGLEPEQWTDPALRTALEAFDLQLVLGHLACGDDRAHERNALQLARFKAALACLPPARASLSASAGAFAGPAYRFDLVRPGIALYGGAPLSGEPNPMSPVAALRATVLQVRSVDSGESVGYGASLRLKRPSRLAILSFGYADGVMRALSSNASVIVNGLPAPIAGRVSMDLLTVDVTGIPGVARGDVAELFGPQRPVDAVAAAAGTIAYELLVRVGARVERRYSGMTA